LPSPLSPAEPPAGWRLRVEDSLPSTSDFLLRLAAAGEPEGLAVLARWQTAGRGRGGRGWQSPPGNLYLSLLLRPRMPAREAGIWSLIAAVALAEALAPALPDPAALRLKWPNDLLLGGAKLAGVLCECAAAGDGQIDWLVIGLGANLAVAPAIEGRAVACLAGHASLPDPVAVATSVLHRIVAWRARLDAEGLAPVLAAWAARGPDHGALLTLRIGGSQTSGLYRGLDGDGALLLEHDGRTRRFASGELTPGGE
jgi:BirA family biotin operon repressor/biotin-[acetyl-CoA-carboxylase] ligase